MKCLSTSNSVACDNKSARRPAHPSSKVSALVIRSLENMMAKYDTCIIVIKAVFSGDNDVPPQPQIESARMLTKL